MKFPGLSAVPESIWAGRPTRRSPKSFPVVPGIQPEPSVIAVLAPFWKFWNLFPFSTLKPTFTAWVFSTLVKLSANCRLEL